MIFPPHPVGRTHLKWPKDAWRIALLSQQKKEAWYAAQVPYELIVSSKDFQKFWSRWYGGHVRMKRLLYRFKFW